MRQTLDVMFDALAESHAQAVIVGGLAVNQYGVSRQTFDLDFVIEDGSAPSLTQALAARGFHVQHQTNDFIRLAPPPNSRGFVLDLLLLDASTFSRMWGAATEVVLDGKSFRVAAPHHLIRMKLHSLQHGAKDRLEKDLPDILGLMRAYGWTPESEAFKEVCRKHASESILNLIRERWSSWRS